jgi:hypothetical protein
MNMATNSRIKVIKLAERKRRAKARVNEGQDPGRSPERDKGPDAAATVNGWVDEMRRQKDEGAGALSAFNDLFEDPK